MSTNITFAESNRRNFLTFLGLASTTLPFSLASAANKSKRSVGIDPSSADDLVVAPGLRYNIVAAYGDKINASGSTFGYDSDFIAYFPLPTVNQRERALLMVNHENTHPLLVSGYTGSGKRTADQLNVEMQSVGCSLIEIENQSAKNENPNWRLVTDSTLNRRIDATSPIPFYPQTELAGAKQAIGTLGNCSGGSTPWGSALSAEENTQDFFGEPRIGAPDDLSAQILGWTDLVTRPAEHYGWVVEINISTGSAQKLIALGRFCHEGATVTSAKDGRAVVYMGDDGADRCFYKFISDSSSDLSKGTLYVANVNKGEWISLDRNAQPALQKKFKTQTEVLVHTRLAAELVGGSPLDRPEGVALRADKATVFLALTNNPLHNRPHGSIARFQEHQQDAASLKFDFEIYIPGGELSGLSCPDNLAFDKFGNLWVTSDISEKSIGADPYASYKNNGLFVVPAAGINAGKVIQVASAPVDAEFTGPCFSDDGSTLFLSVQHPGKRTTDVAKPTSRWSANENGHPRPAVIAFSGIDSWSTANV